MKNELPEDCRKHFEAWELELLKCANQLRREKKPCMIIIRWDGQRYFVHDCLTHYIQIEAKI